MEIIGLGLRLREGQLAITADDGYIADRRIAKSREPFAVEFGGRPRTTSCLSRTEGEWAVHHLDHGGRSSGQRPCPRNGI